MACGNIWAFCSIIILSLWHRTPKRGSPPLPSRYWVSVTYCKNRKAQSNKSQDFLERAVFKHANQVLDSAFRNILVRFNGVLQAFHDLLLDILNPPEDTFPPNLTTTSFAESRTALASFRAAAQAAGSMLQSVLLLIALLSNMRIVAGKPLPEQSLQYLEQEFALQVQPMKFVLTPLLMILLQHDVIIVLCNSQCHCANLQNLWLQKLGQHRDQITHYSRQRQLWDRWLFANGS